MIIGILGQKHSGKSTAAGIISQICGPMALTISFSELIEHEASKIYGDMSQYNKEALRPLYQAIGMTSRSLYGDDYWVNRVKDKWDSVSDYYALLIVDGLRFPMDQRWIASQGGTVIKIRRPHIGSSDGHPSETSVDQVSYDHLIDNTGTLEEFSDEVAGLYELISR